MPAVQDCQSAVMQGRAVHSGDLELRRDANSMDITINAGEQSAVTLLQGHKPKQTANLPEAGPCTCT